MKRKLVRPVKPGDVIQLKINNLNHSGEGVGKYEGFTVFVPSVLPGENVQAVIEEVKSRYARGRAIHSDNFSKEREEPCCSSYAKCGGCHLQHMNYEAQLKFKNQTVIEALRRIGKIEKVNICPPIGMKDIRGYRNKAEYPIIEYNGTLYAGFFKQRSKEGIPIDDCGLQHPLAEKVRRYFIEIAREMKFKAYSMETKRGHIRHLIVRVGVFTGEVMVVVVTAADIRAQLKRAAKELIERVPEVKSVFQSVKINDRNPNVLGEKLYHLYGKKRITEKIGPFEFLISPETFFQVNSVQSEVLFNKVVEYSKLEGKGTAVDAYCGVGAISLFLAQKTQKVYGIEISKKSIENARANAVLNGIKNTEFYAGDVSEIVPNLPIKESDVVVLDPPRGGCDKKALNAVLALKPQRLIYVSCNPSTLARDLSFIVHEHGYKIEEIQVVDMFPNTYHVETVVLMSRL